MPLQEFTEKRQIFSLHPPLVYSFFFAIFLVGFIMYPTRIRPTQLIMSMPDYVLRYLNDTICVLIFGVFCQTLFYGTLQFLGLWAHRILMADFQHTITSRERPFSSHTFKKNGFRIGIVHTLTGRDKGAYVHMVDVLKDRLGRPVFESDIINLYQDITDEHRLRLTGDLYALNFGVWVLPILGFIGTVWGISHSIVGLRELVTGASSSQQLISDLPASMSKVLAGLSTAFDTTFLGLVFAALAMLPVMMLRRMIDRQLMNDYLSLVYTLPAPERETQKSAEVFKAGIQCS